MTEALRQFLEKYGSPEDMAPVGGRGAFIGTNDQGLLVPIAFIDGVPCELSEGPGDFVPDTLCTPPSGDPFHSSDPLLLAAVLKFHSLQARGEAQPGTPL